MNKYYFLISIAAVLLFSSCGQHIFVDYQSESDKTGRVTIKPNFSTYKTFVTINDSLIVENKNVRALTINNVPDGLYMIHYVSYNEYYKDKLDVIIPVQMNDERNMTKLVAVPPMSTGYWINTTAWVIFPLAILFFLPAQ